MKIFALTTVPARAAVQAATGVQPWTSPPWVAETLQPEHLAGHDLIYIRLHGLPDLNGWLGEDDKENYPLALGLENLTGADLGGAIVILANCYGASSPLVPDLYRAGAGAVVAGPGPNMAGGSRVIGTDKLAREIIRAMFAGQDIKRALRSARRKLLWTSYRAADRDAREFKIMEKIT